MTDAWDSIPAEMIQRSFLKCGIANDMDGSEEDVLYDDLLRDIDIGISIRNNLFKISSG